MRDGLRVDRTSETLRRVMVENEEDEANELLGYEEDEKARALSEPLNTNSSRRVKTRVQKFFMGKRESSSLVRCRRWREKREESE